MPRDKAPERRLNLGANVVVMPTVRDADGLALSSRNAHLGPDDRQAALSLSRALRLAERMRANGSADATAMRSAMTALLEDTPGVGSGLRIHSRRRHAVRTGRD